jgi:hypothetical protein
MSNTFGGQRMPPSPFQSIWFSATVSGGPSKTLASQSIKLPGTVSSPGCQSTTTNPKPRKSHRGCMTK